MPNRYKDKEGKFCSKENAVPIKSPVTFHEAFDKFAADMAKSQGVSEKDIAEEILNQQFMVVEFDEATGKASLKFHNFGTDVAIDKMEDSKLMALYKDLRENFPPVSAGIEYHKTFLCGSGFTVLADDPSDKHKIEMRDEIKKFSADVYFDYYRKGLDRILWILADPLLTYGASAAEILYEEDINFLDYATEVATQGGRTWNVRRVQEVKNREWKKLKGIMRLKILDRAIERLNPHVNHKSLEIMYWGLDEKIKTSLTKQIAQKVGEKKEKEGINMLPWQILWLSWNTRGTSLKGQSIIRPVIEIARMVRKILRAVGVGFERWADRKYFFVCGTDKRPWNKIAVRNFLKYLELMIKNHWTGVPVPQGFRVEEIGGDIFEGTNILNYLIGLICAGMNYPRDFLEYGRTLAGDKAWLAWQVKYGSNQRQLRRDIEHQLFRIHLWCNFGRKYRVPKQSVEPKNREKRDIYIPKILWNAEGRWQKKEEIETLLKSLNVANPLGPEMKLGVEKRLAVMFGFGDIELPTFKEIRKQAKLMDKQMEIEMMKQEAQLKKRLQEGVSTAKIETGEKQKPPPKAGGTRKPKTVKKGMPNRSFGESFDESTQKQMEDGIKKAVAEVMSSLALPAVPIEIRIKNEPSEPTKLDVHVIAKTPDSDKKLVEEKIKTEKAIQETEKEKQGAQRKKAETAEKISKKLTEE